MNFDAFMPFTMQITITDPAQIQQVYAVLARSSLAKMSALSEEHAKDIKFFSGHKWEDQQSAAADVEKSDYVTSVEGPVPECGLHLTDDSEVDAHGWPWSADMHAATRGQTKDGLWRMKPGVTRPDPKPGFPLQAQCSESVAVTEETPSETSTPSPESPVVDTVMEPAGSSLIEEPASAVASPEEDEFAAFREAAAKVDAQDAAAAASIPARVWTDADLGALCNQAAVKLGDPAPVKALIAEFVPAGEVAHSRNVPEDERAAFVAAVEAKAGIEFAG